MFKGSGSLGQLLWTQTVLVHFLDRHQAMAEKRILRLVDSPEATGPDLTDDAITRVEQKRLGKRASNLACRNGSAGRSSLNL